MTYERFIFERVDYHSREGKIELHYSLDGELHFVETLQLPKLKRRELPKALLDRLLFNLHLACGISYYKTHCPKHIEIKSGILSQAEAHFWDELYTKGLGEFFYENQLDFRDLIHFPYEEDVEHEWEGVELQDRALVPLGGGKDSIVVAELLKNGGMDFEVFNLGDHPLVHQVAKVMDKKTIVVTRELSENLFQLNEEGALNGHIPISSIIAFLSLLMAHLYDFKWIVLGNEHSANEGNLEYLGQEINHQYSKSYEFEAALHSYVRTFLKSDVEYFSLLRPWNEIKIAQAFSFCPEYFGVFSSCNRNFKVKGPSKSAQWCGECPKCAFVFAMLAPFVTQERLLEIFGDNLFERADLWPLFKDLLGIGTAKPFECVGTPEEVAAAFWMAVALPNGPYDDSVILEHFLDFAQDVPVYEESVFGWKEPHLLPEKFIPFLQNQNVMILGHGAEGQVNEAFFRTRTPNWFIDVKDQKNGADYMDALFAYDYIVKSPGIPWQPALKLVEARVTSGTQLFFSGLDSSNKVVGVTGSKGKSTTATLLYEMLKDADLPFDSVKLVGNIGEPALSHVDAKNTLFVYELSSYQLEGLRASPDIAIITSFFPDHLDYHEGLANYLGAKLNITRFQNENDVLIFPEKYVILQQVESKAKMLPLPSTGPFKTQLKGKHNQDNIALAAAAATLLGASKVDIQNALDRFKGLPHRLEEVGIFHEILFVDDANATTPEGTLAALEVYGSQVGTLFLGGEDRGYDFSQLATRIHELKIPNIVLFPDTGARIKEAIGKGPHYFETKSMKAAVEWAYANTAPESVCLMSMASPSYSLFKNYKEKGERFQKWVKTLGS